METLSQVEREEPGKPLDPGASFDGQGSIDTAAARGKSDGVDAAPDSLPPVEAPSVFLPPSFQSELAAGFGRLEERIDRLSNELTSANARSKPADHGAERMLAELHKQLQEAKAGDHWKILRGVLVELVKVYDQLTALVAKPPIDETQARQVCEDLRQDVEDILYRQGFAPFQNQGDQFDGRRQQPTRTIEAPSPDHVGLVASRVASGFASEDRLLRPEKVVVYAAPRPTANSTTS